VINRASLWLARDDDAGKGAELRLCTETERYPLSAEDALTTAPIDANADIVAISKMLGRGWPA
jgi:hypothetical protein